MYARLEVTLRNPQSFEQIKSMLRGSDDLPTHDFNATIGTLFQRSSETTRASDEAHIAYAGRNMGYVIIVSWYTNDSLEVNVESVSAKTRRATAETWRALARIFKRNNARAKLSNASLVEEVTDEELERGYLGFRRHLQGAFSPLALLTAALTTVFAAMAAKFSKDEGKLWAFLLACAPALALLLVGVVNALVRWWRKELVWRTIR